MKPCSNLKKIYQKHVIGFTSQSEIQAQLNAFRNIPFAEQTDQQRQRQKQLWQALKLAKQK